jgi:hypothetical protein
MRGFSSFLYGNFQAQDHKETQHILGGFGATKPSISCNYLQFPKGEDMKEISKPQSESVYYYFKCCIEAGVLKITLFGEAVEKL